MEGFHWQIYSLNYFCTLEFHLLYTLRLPLIQKKITLVLHLSLPLQRLHLLKVNYSFHISSIATYKMKHLTGGLDPVLGHSLKRHALNSSLKSMSKMDS